MPPIKAIIFDMDDTLISSATSWQHAERRLYERLGATYSAEVSERYKGMNAWDVARTIHAYLTAPSLSAEECGRLLREYLFEEFSRPLEQKAGADSCVRALAVYYPLCIASGSPLEAINQVVAQCGWTGLFSCIVSSESVAHGKPAPDVFLAATAQMAMPPAACLVVEDSLHGATAAQRAGMPCVVVPSSDDPAIPRAATRALPTLAALTPALVETFAQMPI